MSASMRLRAKKICARQHTRLVHFSLCVCTRFVHFSLCAHTPLVHFFVHRMDADAASSAADEAPDMNALIRARMAESLTPALMTLDDTLQEARNPKPFEITKTPTPTELEHITFVPPGKSESKTFRPYYCMTVSPNEKIKPSVIDEHLAVFNARHLISVAYVIRKGQR